MSLSDKLNQLIDQLSFVGAESTLIVGAMILLLAGLLTKKRGVIRVIFLLVLVAALIIQYFTPGSGSLLLGSLNVAASSTQFSMLFLASGLLLLVFHRAAKHAPEFHFLIIAGLVGALILMKAGSLLIIYLAVELLSFTSYILTSFSFKKEGFEASLKYLLFGAVSSAIMLFGLGMIYGATGTTYLEDVYQFAGTSTMMELGIVLLVVGLFFKASVFPLHIWVPAAYQSAPVDAAAFISIVPKLASLVFMRELMLNGLFEESSITVLIKILGISTIIVGTLGAFMQQNVRRMISFGAVAHTGFLLPFIFLTSETAMDAFWYYAVVYLIMNFAVFYLLGKFEEQGIYTVSDYKALPNSAFLGVALTFVLVSLVGIPPLAGFTAKFFLFVSLWESYSVFRVNSDLWYLLVAVAATVGSLFFYFRVPAAIFLSDSLAQSRSKLLKSSVQTKIVATLFILGLLLLFFVPEIVYDLKLMFTYLHE